MAPQGAVRQGKWGSGLVLDKSQDKGALPVVALGVLAISAAAIFIRLAETSAVAFWRCTLGAAVLLPPAFVRGDRFPTGRALYVGVASGVALGGHFVFWISSLSFTSVVASVVLVSTQPVFVAVLAYLVFGEQITLVSFADILVALAGTAVIAADKTVGSAALSGNVLALVGTVTVGVYVLIGRSSRTGGVGVLPYSVVVYAATAASLLPAALVFDAPLWDYSGETRVIDWALRYVEASVISGLALAEPVISALLA